MNQLLQGTSFNSSFDDKMGSVLTLVDNASGMFADYKSLSTTQILEKFAGKDNIEGFFALGDYNLTKWMDDFQSAAKGQYYTQRVYIYRRDYGNEKLCDYQPPTDDNSILYGDQWYRINTKDENFYPNSSQTEAILSNSENFAGWNRKKVSELNAQDSKYKYNIYYSRSAYILSKKKSGMYAKAYAYSISVTKSWDVKEEVYEAVFDSYSMDWNTFMAQMNAHLAQYNANGEHQEIENSEQLNDYISQHPQESNYTYYIGYDNRRYYSATDARKLAGSSSATFTITCHDGVQLGKGSTTYKCGSCGKYVDNHTKKCSMATTLGGDSQIDTNELQAKLGDLQKETAHLQAQQDALNKENSELLRKMSQSTSSAATDSYRNMRKTRRKFQSCNHRLMRPTNKSPKQSKLCKKQRKVREPRRMITIAFPS
jgi:predicted RNA-binding Zn-ribbon protein involved in translation (DUF1610 family)